MNEYILGSGGVIRDYPRVFADLSKGVTQSSTLEEGSELKPPPESSFDPDL